MLQIISGKFFANKDRYCHDGKGIVFGNYLWVQPIKTCVATLEPVDNYASVASYVISYVNQIEKEPEQKPTVLVRTGDSEIVEQFQLLCTFGLRAFFHQDRHTVAFNCRQHPVSSSDYHVPSVFVPRFFSRQIHGSSTEVEAFAAFVDKVIGLRRNVYKAIIACLRNFAHALQILSHNIDLSYSLIVYSLESLSQGFDGYDPVWDDYQEEVRTELDRILSEVPQEAAGRIRSSLLGSSNLKLQRRFADFVAAHVRNTFFTDEAPRTEHTLRKSELIFALRNAYNMRSQYAHKILPIQEQLKIPQLAAGDVFRWKNQPYLNMAGMVRVAHHAIMTFIERQEHVEKEDVPWRTELPGCVRLEMAPQCWMWWHEGIRPEDATQKLSGFLLQLETFLLTGEPLTDIRKLLEEYERLLPNAKKPLKLQMLATYYLYNFLVKSEGKRPDWKEVCKKYEKLFKECSIEMMLTLLLFEQKWTWEKQQCVAQWDNYMKQRLKKNGLSIPPLMELALLAKIGYAHLESGSEEYYVRTIDTAMTEAAGRPYVQALLREARDTRRDLQYEEIYGAAKKDQTL